MSLSDSKPGRRHNEPVQVTGIWLRNLVGEPYGLMQLQVLAEVDGEWRVVIEELADGPISHIVEPGGIESGRPDR